MRFVLLAGIALLATSVAVERWVAFRFAANAGADATRARTPQWVPFVTSLAYLGVVLSAALILASL